MYVESEERDTREWERERVGVCRRIGREFALLWGELWIFRSEQELLPPKLVLRVLCTQYC